MEKKKKERQIRTRCYNLLNHFKVGWKIIIVKILAFWKQISQIQISSNLNFSQIRSSSRRRY